MPLTVCECCLDSFDDTAATFRAQLDPILHDIESAALFLPDPCIALALEDLEDLGLGEIIGHCDRKGDDAIDDVFVAVGNFDDGAGPTWYLLDTSRAVRPIIWQEREKYEFQNVNRLNDERVFMTDNFLYGIRARVNAASACGSWPMPAAKP